MIFYSVCGRRWQEQANFGGAEYILMTFLLKGRQTNAYRSTNSTENRVPINRQVYFNQKEAFNINAS